MLHHARVNPWELLASAFGVANLLLLGRRSVWNYPCGMVMVAIFAVIFFQARLYAVAGLQIFFFAAQFHGLWEWRRAGGGDDGVPVRRLPVRHWPLVLMAGTGLSVAIALLLRQTDAAAPIVDGSVAAWSLVAQALTNWRMVESWPLWVGINIASVALYAGQALWVTALLYLLFLAIALYSWRAWHRALPA